MRDTVTYIVKTQELYKIGETRYCSLKARIAAYITHNPYMEIVRIYHGDVEKQMQAEMMHKHSHAEWFSLSVDDLQLLDSLASSLSTCPMESELLGKHPKDMKQSRRLYRIDKHKFIEPYAN